MAGKEVTKAEEAKVPATYDYGEDAGMGYQNQTDADVKMPFLVLLQSGNDEVKKKNPAYVEGAEEGLFMNSVTKELYGDTVQFVPAVTDHHYVQWRHRDDGGGFIARHDLNSDAVKNAFGDFGKLKIKGKSKDGTKDEDHQLVEYFNIYGVIVTEEGDVLSPAIMAFKSTAIKQYQSAMSRLRMFQVGEPGKKVRPPLFAHRLEITVKGDSNDQGSWVLPVLKGVVEDNLLKGLMQPDDPRYQAAREIMVLHEANKLDVDYESTSNTEKSEDDGPEIF